MEAQCELNKLECPFTWEECCTKFDDIDWEERTENKRSKPSCNDWELYVYSVFLGCIYGHKKEEEKAFEILDSIEKHVAVKTNDSFFKDLVDGMCHVITASKCHIYALTGKPLKVSDAANAIKPFKDLSKQSQAAVLATKAFVLNDFGYDGKVKAVECMKMAIELDPDNDGTRKGAWYYYLGKNLAQLRRVRSYFELPSKEELKMLERSVQNDPFPVHIVALADSYREAAKIYFNSRKDRSMSESLCQAAQNMYQRIIGEKDLSVGVLRRCGNGLMKLPKKFRDLKLAEETLQMALQIHPDNQHVLLALGNLEEWHKNNPRAALNYYEKSYECGNTLGIIYMMKLRYELDEAYDPVKDCDRGIAHMQESLQSRMSLHQMSGFMLIKGEFYLFIKNDLLAAAREWEKAMKIMPSSNQFKEYMCSFIERKDKLNIYETLKVEIMKALISSKYHGEDEIYLNSLLKEILNYQLDSNQKEGTKMEGSPPKDVHDEENAKSLDGAIDSFSKLEVSDKNIKEESNSIKDEQKLNELECPYTWKECYSKFNDIDWEEFLLDKLSRPYCNDWRLYGFKLLLACYYGHKREEEKALETFESCEKHVAGKANDIFFKDLMDGIHHVINASKCHFYSQNGKPEKANDMFSNTKPFKELSKESQAAVMATKAYILIDFGYEGKNKSVECARKAIELDPDENGTRRGAWYYLAGKVLAQIRRINSYDELPSREELQMLERSVRKNPFTVHLVVLADSYREAAKIHFKMSRNPKGMSSKLALAAQDMYQKAIRDKDVNVGVLRRCGSGLMKLPRKNRDVKLAEEALKMAIGIAPENKNVLLALGNLENWHKNNPTAALSYYEKASKFGNEIGTINMIKLRYKLNKAYDPVDDCNKAIERVSDLLQSKMTVETKATFMIIKGEYNLHVKRDLLSAAREWENAIKTAPKANCLLKYECAFNEMVRDLNIYEKLQQEIQRALGSKKYCKEDEIYLEGILKLCREKPLDLF